MSAAQSTMDLAASNIANAGAAQTRRSESAAAAPQAEAAPPREAAKSAPSIETDMVGMLSSKNAFLANLAVFRSSDRSVGGLICLNS